MERRPSGYTTRASIGGGPGGRGRPVLAVAAVIGVAWLVLVAGGKRPPSTAISSPIAPEATETAAAPSLLLPTPLPPTFPPDVERFRNVLLAPMPVLFPCLGWLDAASASSTGACSEVEQQLAFARWDGSAMCVCLDPGGPLADDVLRLVDHAPDGQPMAERSIDVPLRTRDGDVLDAAALPDGAGAVLATGRVTADGIAVRLDIVPLGGPRAADHLGLGTVRSPADAKLDELKLWLAPDARTVAVRLVPHTSPFEERRSGGGAAWLVPIGDAGFGPPRRAPAAMLEHVEWCPAEGWADERRFLQACVMRTSGEYRVELTATDDDGGTRTADGGPLNATSWLVDRSSEMAFGWDPYNRILQRFDLASLRMSARLLPSSAEGFTAEAPLPDRRPGRVHWEPLSPTPGTVIGGPLVGSADGSLLYVAEPAEPGRLTGFPSGGVWIVDATTLSVVDWWPPAAGYTQVTLSPDGRFLIGIGDPLPTEVDVFGSHGPSLVVHDVRNGEVVEIIRRLNLQLGGIPAFLFPQP